MIFDNNVLAFHAPRDHSDSCGYVFRSAQLCNLQTKFCSVLLLSNLCYLISGLSTGEAAPALGASICGGIVLYLIRSAVLIVHVG